MSGAFSSSVSVTIPLTATEVSASVMNVNQLGNYANNGDATGDGIPDVMLWSYTYTSSNYRYSFRIINPVTGQEKFNFDNGSYSYFPNFDLQDLDNDGKVELIVERSNFPSGNQTQLVVFATDGVATSVNTASQPLPQRTNLNQNYPNPFNPTTTIQFSNPSFGPINIEITDITGRVVRNINCGSLEPGVHEITWDGKDASGMSASSGTYLYRMLNGNGSSDVRKMILLR